jgi:hypothetical protein
MSRVSLRWMSIAGLLSFFQPLLAMAEPLSFPEYPEWSWWTHLAPNRRAIFETEVQKTIRTLAKKAGEDPIVYPFTGYAPNNRYDKDPVLREYLSAAWATAQGQGLKVGNALGQKKLSALGRHFGQALFAIHRQHHVDPSDIAYRGFTGADPKYIGSTDPPAACKASRKAAGAFLRVEGKKAASLVGYQRPGRRPGHH